VIETPEGITVYAARCEGDRWRAVWYEDGERRQCQAASEDRLAASLEKVAVRLAADAPNMLRTGDELIACYLSGDRLPAERQWSRKHAETQRYLCERFVRPVLGQLACQDIRVADMQAVVNAAPTAKEGRRVRAMISALTGAGITGGYLANPRLKEVHWQAKGRAVAAPRTVPAGESVLFVDPGDIPAADDIARLGHALAAPRWGLYELMVQFAAYTGLRWGELAALTAAQVSPEARAVAVDRKVIEIRGQLYVEAPKNRKWRQAVYPSLTPRGWPLADMVTARIAAVSAEQAAGANPQGLMFPASAGGYWRSSNFRRRVLEDGYLAAGWRAADGAGRWTWHSLRHVFCTAALFDWQLDITDVAKLAGHANHRITWEMYVGSTAGTLDRARAATAGPVIPLPPVPLPRPAGAGQSGLLAAGALR
jgi:integrase